MRIVARLETEGVVRQVSGSPEQVAAWTRQALGSLHGANMAIVTNIMRAVQYEMAHFGYSLGYLCSLGNYDVEGWYWPYLCVWAFDQRGRRLPIYTTVAFSDEDGPLRGRRGHNGND